jgi:mediator of RNA polymerase II transcription subunit 14
MSPEDRNAWIHEINIALNMRLQLHEYERTPRPFRDYTIADGRVTFKVDGEFELDLTIADDDFEKQFWFIDFRFLFSPATSQISDRAKEFMASKVNDALATDGLLGCYKYLHEFTLTTKISEFGRQAMVLSTEKWIDTLKIERLYRALSIQYWIHRPHSQATKSWIILGVRSGQGPDGEESPESPSHIALRWFRDGKEVKDIAIPFDVDTISTEKLLTTIVAKHVEHLLSSIYNRLLSKPRFAQGQARLALNISEEPSESSLTMQLHGEHDITLQIERWMGPFTLLPRTAVIIEGERKFNSSANPAEEGAASLEQLRCYFTMTDMKTHGRTVGWDVIRCPISAEELKSLVYSGAPSYGEVHQAVSSREAYQTVWMRYASWNPQWFVMISMSLGGDQWWLIEL